MVWFLRSNGVIKMATNTILNYNGMPAYLYSDQYHRTLKTAAKTIYLNSNSWNTFCSMNNGQANYSTFNKFNYKFVENGGYLFYNLRFMGSASGVSFNFPNLINGNSMFKFTKSFNAPVMIGENCVDMSNMFGSCFEFNQSMNLPDNIVNCSYSFADCNNLNQPIVLPNNLTESIRTFYNCQNFNQNIFIPSKITNSSEMFYNCWNLRTVSGSFNNITAANEMFRNCKNMTISGSTVCFKKAKNIAHIFSNCDGNLLSGKTFIFNNATNVQNAFNGCGSIGGDFYFDGHAPNTKNLFRGSDGSRRINIYTYNNYFFRNTTASGSITGTAISYTKNTANSCIYNVMYNIYIYSTS